MGCGEPAGLERVADLYRSRALAPQGYRTATEG